MIWTVNAIQWNKRFLRRRKDCRKPSWRPFRDLVPTKGREIVIMFGDLGATTLNRKYCCWSKDIDVDQSLTVDYVWFENFRELILSDQDKFFDDWSLLFRELFAAYSNWKICFHILRAPLLKLEKKFWRLQINCMISMIFESFLQEQNVSCKNNVFFAGVFQSICKNKVFFCKNLHDIL